MEFFAKKYPNVLERRSILELNFELVLDLAHNFFSEVIFFFLDTFTNFETNEASNCTILLRNVLANS